MRQAFGRIAPGALLLLAIACAAPTKPDPVVQLSLQSVNPSAGPATGGTEVTIRGAGFAAGTAVTIGGANALDVSARGDDVLVARTPASTVAGAVDVVVTVNGKTATLTGGFTYQAIGPNSMPIIKSMTAQGKRLRQPPNFADYGETIQLSVIVDDDAPVELTYQWRPCGGTLTGFGPQVEWTAPAFGTLPSACTIEVTILDGPHVLTRSVVVRLHNSIEDVRRLALEFLTEFADSTIPAATTVRNFSELSSDCREGKAAELKDVQDNRRDYIINSHTYGEAAININFGGVCAFRSRTADACIATPVEWRSTKLKDGTPEVAKGTSFITGVYQDSRWWLCRSEYRGDPGTSLTFMH